jgi:hypothetical protein
MKCNVILAFQLIYLAHIEVYPKEVLGHRDFQSNFALVRRKTNIALNQEGQDKRLDLLHTDEACDNTLAISPHVVFTDRHQSLRKLRNGNSLLDTIRLRGGSPNFGSQPKSKGKRTSTYHSESLHSSIEEPPMPIQDSSSSMGTSSSSDSADSQSNHEDLGRVPDAPKEGRKQRFTAEYLSEELSVPSEGSQSLLPAENDDKTHEPRNGDDDTSQDGVESGSGAGIRGDEGVRADSAVADGEGEVGHYGEAARDGSGGSEERTGESGNDEGDGGSNENGREESGDDVGGGGDNVGGGDDDSDGGDDDNGGGGGDDDVEGGDGGVESGEDGESASDETDDGTAPAPAPYTKPPAATAGAAAVSAPVLPVGIGLPPSVFEVPAEAVVEEDEAMMAALDAALERLRRAQEPPGWQMRPEDSFHRCVRVRAR